MHNVPLPTTVPPFTLILGLPRVILLRDQSSLKHLGLVFNPQIHQLLGIFSYLHFLCCIIRRGQRFHDWFSFHRLGLQKDRCQTFPNRISASILFLLSPLTSRRAVTYLRLRPKHIIGWRLDDPTNIHLLALKSIDYSRSTKVHNFRWLSVNLCFFSLAFFSELFGFRY